MPWLEALTGTVGAVMAMVIDKNVYRWTVPMSLAAEPLKAKKRVNT
jgi:hypothetical protein